MSQDANQPATCQRVIAALSQIIGLSLTAVRRAADMRMFHFGQLCPVDRGSVGDFALHVQCAWRIEGPDGIVTGRSDLWEPAEENASFDEDWDYEKSPNLQDARLERWLTQEPLSLVVESVDADRFGGATIRFGQGFVLRLFPAGTRGEDWRLFRPNTDASHLVIAGGVVESDDEMECDIAMNSPLAPEPILRAALRVVHVAAYTTRNWAMSEGISRKQIYDLWEAIHEIPDLIKRWRGDESLRELRIYFQEYNQSWSLPKLEQIFDQALRDSNP